MIKIYDVKVNRKLVGKVITKGGLWGAYNLQGKLVCQRETKKEAVAFLKGEEPDYNYGNGVK